MSDTAEGPGWWQASDGKWYAPETQTAAHPPAPDPEEELDAGEGHFGDGITKPLYEFKASRLKGRTDVLTQRHSGVARPDRRV